MRRGKLSTLTLVKPVYETRPDARVAEAKTNNHYRTREYAILIAVINSSITELVRQAGTTGAREHEMLGPNSIALSYLDFCSVCQPALAVTQARHPRLLRRDQSHLSLPFPLPTVMFTSKGPEKIKNKLCTLDKGGVSMFALMS